MRCAVLATLSLAGVVCAQAWRAPEPASVRVPGAGESPVIACTPAELAALRAAYQAGTKMIVQRVRGAEKALQDDVAYPPRGGQHNQWYQCDACQLGLTTVDATHHACPSCGEVYSGPPYDDVIFSRVHGSYLHRATESAWAFALTGEARFAEDATRILTGYAERYENYPYHSNSADPSKRQSSGGHLKEQTLSEASWMISMVIPAYDLIRATLNADERRQITEHLVLPMIENVAKCRRGKSNWQSFHNAAMFWGGAVLGDAKWMKRAIFDEQDGFLFQMRRCVSSDGMWYENSWGYHIYTLHALVALAEGARRCGIDLWGHPALVRMCTLPAQYTMADGRLPRFGDDVNSSLSQARRLFEAAWAATGDAEILGLLPASESWETIMYRREAGRAANAPPPRSAVFRGAGHAILRTHGEGALTAAFTFGPFGGFHGHFDKLSFVWHGFGSELGVDPGRARSQAYRLPVHNEWYRGTIPHNAVTVDGRPQRGAAGELLAFVEGDGFAAAAARCTEAYPGVDHARCLVLTEEYLVVLDLLDAGNAPHRFDWLYHHRGIGVESDAAAGRPAESLSLDGDDFVDLLGSGKTDDIVRAVFPGKAVTTSLYLAATPGTEVHRGTGVGASTLERVPLLIARRVGEKVSYAAVLEPSTAECAPSVTGLRCQRIGAGLAVEVRRGKKTDRITWDGATRITMQR